MAVRETAIPLNASPRETECLRRLFWCANCAVRTAVASVLLQPIEHVATPASFERLLRSEADPDRIEK